MEDFFNGWKSILKYFLNFKGLRDIHLLNIVHLDIKPGNILIDSTGILKIGDFGHAAKCPVVFLKILTKIRLIQMSMKEIEHILHLNFGIVVMLEHQQTYLVLGF